ncbi:MAG: carbon storage regulator CsrA [Thermoanaerobacteraceae bacterium]
MLILTRKIGQSVIIGGNIEINILEIEEDKVKIGVNAPKEISILRKELVEVKDENTKAIQINKEILSKLENFIKKR